MGGAPCRAPAAEIAAASRPRRIRGGGGVARAPNPPRKSPPRGISTAVLASLRIPRGRRARAFDGTERTQAARANSVNMANWYLVEPWPGTVRISPPLSSRWSTSRSEIADLSAHDQLTRRDARYVMPASWNRTNASVTAFAHFSSIVKRSRAQSTDDPSRRSCVQIRDPYWPFQAQTCFKNSSRPRSWRDTGGACFASIFSTTDLRARSRRRGAFKES